MKKRIIILISIFFVFVFAGIKGLEKLVRKKLNFLPFKIDDISISFTGAKVKNLKYIKDDFSVNLKELRIKPSPILTSFAFASPGEIQKQQEKRTITIKGRISGNVKNGNINIEKTFVEIGNMGDFYIEGSLKNWGKTQQNVRVNLNKVDIKQVGDFLNIKIPVAGLVSGNMEIIQEKMEQNINFDIKIENLSVKGGSKVIVFVKGAFTPQRKKGKIEKGKALIDGKELYFNGNFDNDNFSFSFEGEEIEIQKILDLLPEEIKKKYNLNISGVVDFNTFFVKRIKKNLKFQAI